MRSQCRKLGAARKQKHLGFPQAMPLAELSKVQNKSVADLAVDTCFVSSAAKDRDTRVECNTGTHDL